MKNIFTVIIIFVCVLFLSIKTNAQNNLELVKAQTYLLQKGEVYFTFNISSKDEIITLTQIISIDHNSRGNQIFAYANTNEFNSFLNLGYSYTVLPHPGDETEGIEMHSSEKGIWQFDTYPTYTEYETMMTTFAANYPDICKLVQIGITPGGRKLLVVKISDNVNQSESEPQFLYTSTMHGDETTGYILLLRLINHLLTNYGTNSEVTGLVNNMEIWINPNANPDGTYAGGNNTVSGATRANFNNIDLNRNYPGPTGLHPDGNAYQQETIDFMAFADSMNFVMSANFHGGVEVVNYPFDTYTSGQKTHADDNWCQFVSREFADTVHIYGPTHMTDLDNGITNGGDWYVVYGSRQDQMCFFEQGRETTIELSASKLLAANQLNAYWTYYYRSLINYMKQASFGIRGIITDACTGAPIEAKVFVNTHDRDSSHIFSGIRHGDYYRPIMAGTYSVTFSADGYISQTKNVTVANLDTTVINVQLAPVVPSADFTSDVTTTCSGTVNFTCLTGAVNSWNWNFGDGSTSVLQNPSHTYTQSGLYTVTLSVGNCAGNDQIIQSDYITSNIVATPVVTNASRCGTGSVNLIAASTGSLYWYDAPAGGNILAVNDTFVTPALNQTTTYYVESVVNQPSQYIGIVSSTTNGSLYNQANIAWLAFDCLTTINLVSAEVNAGTSGNREIYVLNSAGSKIDSVIVNIPSGVSRVNLNFVIPAGTGYRLVGGANANLYRSSTGVAYPYTISGVVSITGAGIPSTPSLPNRYYYFYNWEVQENGCFSARVPATATISAGPEGGIAQAALSSICAGSNTSISLTGNSGSSLQWQQSPDGVNSWTNVTGGSGSTTDTYTTSFIETTTFYRAVVSETGCSDSYSTVSQITVNSIPVINIVNSNVTCNGGSDGTATANVTNGQNPFIYEWSNGGSVNSLLNLNSGMYYVTVTDAVMCSATSSVSVAEPLLINITTATTDATCGNSNGSASATASGGTGTITFYWSNNVSGNIIQNVLAGAYSVTATDGNGCFEVSSIVINNQAQFNVSISSTAIQCYGDMSATATANVTGGSLPITYLWSTGGTGNVVTGLGAGNVTVTITDNNNCSTILTELISQPEAIVANLNATSTTCGFNNGLIEAIASGGTGTLSYLWSNGAVTYNQSNLAVGPYSVTVTDINNCSSVYFGLVNEIPSVTGIISVQNVSCNGGATGSATVTANNGTLPYTYYWTTGSTSDYISSLSAGSVSVTVTDNDGCTTIVTNSVSEPMPILIDLVITSESFAGASDGSAVANVSGGTAPFNFSWSNGNHSDSITGMPAGTYSLAIIDANGCFFTTPVVIDVLNSVADLSEKQIINIYPNPAKNSIEVVSSEKIFKIELLSVSGKILFTSEVISNRNVINLAQFSNGYYFIRLTKITGSTVIQKFEIVK